MQTGTAHCEFACNKLVGEIQPLQTLDSILSGRLNGPRSVRLSAVLVSKKHVTYPGKSCFYKRKRGIPLNSTISTQYKTEEPKITYDDKGDNEAHNK